MPPLCRHSFPSKTSTLVQLCRRHSFGGSGEQAHQLMNARPRALCTIPSGLRTLSLALPSSRPSHTTISPSSRVVLPGASHFLRSNGPARSISNYRAARRPAASPPGPLVPPPRNISTVRQEEAASCRGQTSTQTIQAATGWGRVSPRDLLSRGSLMSGTPRPVT